MEPTPLHFVWNYTDIDKAFWDEHLDGWIGPRVVDAHVHIADLAHRIEPMTEEKRLQFWVNELDAPITAADMSRCDEIVYPGREVTHLAFGSPSLAYDIEASNEYVRRECVERGWLCLAVLPVDWSSERADQELDKEAVIGFKPYYSLIGRSVNTRDRFLEASIFDFLQPPVLEAANRRGAWITLHVPKADRLGHPDNISEIQQIRSRYPDITLVIAHLGRCYTLPHARESFSRLADDEGLYFDISAVLNRDVLRLALETFGPERLIYGTDNPIFYMRGRRQWAGRNYINRTSHPFHFNKDREDPQVEAAYTLYTYEALLALKLACQDVGISADQVEAILSCNAQRMMGSVVSDLGR